MAYFPICPFILIRCLMYRILLKFPFQAAKNFENICFTRTISIHRFQVGKIFSWHFLVVCIQI